LYSIVFAQCVFALFAIYIEKYVVSGEIYIIFRLKMNATKVLVIEYVSEDIQLEDVLLSQNFQVFSLLPDALNIETVADDIKPDVILINSRKVTDSIMQFITDINRVYESPIVLFSDDPDTHSVNKVIEAGISAYIVSGLESNRIKSIIDIGIARFKKQQSLKKELEQTKSKLEDRKLTDRAKGILIKTRGFSEDEAYHTLRKLAMDRNISLGEMAKNVISMAELLEH